MRDRAGTARAPRRPSRRFSASIAGLWRGIRWPARRRRGPSRCSPRTNRRLRGRSAAPERRRAAAAIAKGCAARRMRRACGFRERKRGVGAERDKRSGSGEALHRRNWCTARGASSKALDTGIARRRPGLRPGRPPAALAARRPRRQVSLGRAPPVPEETSTDCLSFPEVRQPLTWDCSDASTHAKAAI